jgi:hypothetical protein
MSSPRRWRRPAAIAAVAVALLAGATTLAITRSGSSNGDQVVTAATTPVQPPSPTPSGNPLDTPRGKFRANVAVTLTCVDGKPELKAWLLVDAPQGGNANQAVTTTQPQMLGGVCIALFQPTLNTQYYVFRKLRPTRGTVFTGWGMAGTSEHSYAHDTYLIADARGTATLVVLSTASLPTGVPLAYYTNKDSFSEYFGAPTVIPPPPQVS